mmetsp:Transcript_76785/g.156107  ORF Transcript_76785/g.156107 Transcript_76785/m.156107 type:complete len:230 (+) Transcript_76785:2452-3141(+)
MQQMEQCCRRRFVKYSSAVSWRLTKQRPSLCVSDELKYVAIPKDRKLQMSRFRTQSLRSKIASCSRTFSDSALCSKLRMAFAGKKETSVRPAVRRVPRAIIPIARKRVSSVSRSKGAKVCAMGVSTSNVFARCCSPQSTLGLKRVANSHVPQQREDQNTKALTAQRANEEKVQSKLDTVLVSACRMLCHFALSAKHHRVAEAARVRTTILKSSSSVNGSVLQVCSPKSC